VALFDQEKEKMIVKFLSRDRVIVRHNDSINFLVIVFDEESRVVSVQDSQNCEDYDEWLGG